MTQVRFERPTAMQPDEHQAAMREIEWLNSVLKDLRPGENAFDASRRRLVTAALIHADGKQQRAAKLLRVSPRMINYHAQDYRLRPMDRGGA